MVVEKEQELEWIEAQKIVISEDLVAAAKRQLEFLATVDKNRWLYQGPALQRVIYRYNAFWLPLLAKASKSQISDGPLVVPLDCEWVWHCHRLNPVRYKFDCMKFFGRVLDNHNVVSSVQGMSESGTREIWSKLYPNEPFDFDMTSILSQELSEEVANAEKYTTYDLTSAIERQSPFFFQVSRPHVKDDLFLEGALARYKGFLHLIKRNVKRSIKSFSVPTYDIDLMWHTHQLHPVSYCKDLVETMGKVLEHDDTDADRTKGKKLDTGFSQTTKHWEETFGSRYWRAGAMYRGSAPSPVTTTPFTPNIVNKAVVAPPDGYQKIIRLAEVKVLEVVLEFVDIINLPEGHKGSVSVIFSKSQPDTIFSTKRKLSILSESGEKQVALFNCQPIGHLLFELVSNSASSLPLSRPEKTIGSASFSLEELLKSVSNLSVEKWLEFVPSPGNVNSKPISLRVAISLTTPIRAPYVLQMVHPRPFSKSSCFFPLPGRVQSAKSWTRVTDETDNEVISLQMREYKKEKGRKDKMFRKEVIGITKSGETHILAEFEGTTWSLIDSQWSLPLQKNNKDGHLFELTGHRMVKIFPGRKLEYQPKHCDKRRNDRDFLTVVEFSAEDPYGRAVALLDLKSGSFQVQEEWLVLPGITLAFIFSDILKREGYGAFAFSGENLKSDPSSEKVDGGNEEGEKTKLVTVASKEVELNAEVAKENTVVAEKVVESGACGGCGGGCGDMVKSGNMVKSGGCGGCGGGNMVKSGGCGGCGGGGCGGGNMVKSGDCAVAVGEVVVAVEVEIW